MNPQNKALICIVVHFGLVDTTKLTIAALLQGKKKPDQIIIIDHSENGINFKHEKVIVIHPNKNGGYGAGINVGLGVLTGRGIKPQDIVVVMNNDALAAANDLALIDEWFKSRRQLALLGAAWGAINFLSGRTTLTGKRRQKNAYIHGAIFAAPLGLFLQMQGLAEEYFLYWEDVEFSQRVVAAGYSLVVLPELKIKHDDEESQMPVEKIYYLVRNGALFLEKKTKLPIRLWWWTANRLRLFYHRWHKNAVVAAALQDAINNVTGIKKSS